MPNPRSRRRQPRIDRRALILQHAEALFAVRGCESTKVSDICSSAARSACETTGSARGTALPPVAWRRARLRLDRTRARRSHWTIAATDAFATRGRQFHSAFANFLREGVSRGRVRDDLPIEALAEMIGSVFSCMALNWVHTDDYPVEERTRDFARFLVEVLAPRGEPTSAACE